MYLRVELIKCFISTGPILEVSKTRSTLIRMLPSDVYQSRVCYLYLLIYREPKAVLFLTGPRICGILNLNLMTEILILQALFDLLRENEWRQFAILTSFDTYGELGDVCHHFCQCFI